MVITILAWIVGVLLTVVGGVWWFCNALMRPLNEAEVRMMQENGKLSEDEPEFMKDFRVARSEGDLMDNLRARPKAIGIFVAGVVIIVALILRSVL